MARDQVDLTPIESRDELVAWFAEGIKPKSQFRIGTEHEKFAFTLEGHEPVPYEGRARHPRAAQRHAASARLGADHGGPNIIGLDDVTGGGAISLEPGGQFELSGAPVETVHQTASELMAHLAQVREIARPLRHRLPRPRHDAEMDARARCRRCRRAATDHDRLHAEGRHATAST